jgi:hypothetical protein
MAHYPPHYFHNATLCETIAVRGIALYWAWLNWLFLLRDLPPAPVFGNVESVVIYEVGFSHPNISHPSRS